MGAGVLVSALVQQREVVPELSLVELPAMGHIRNVMQFIPPSSPLKIRHATFMISRKGKGRSFRRRSKALHRWYIRMKNLLLSVSVYRTVSREGKCIRLLAHKYARYGMS